MWDEIVVGSGLVGAAVGRRLLDAGRRVLMVERGRAVSEPPGSHVRNSAAMQDRPDRYFAEIDRYCDYLDVEAPAAQLPGAFTTSIVGGMGILWTNNCPRAVAGVDRPDLMTDDEWQVYYAVAEHYLGVRVDEFDDSRRQQLVAARLRPALAEQGRRIVRLPLSGSRQGAEHIRYVGPADVVDPASGPLEVVSGTAERIEVSAGRATAVVVDGVAHEASNVVVAAGAVDTPTVLWRSGLHRPALGAHLSYHPVLMGQVVLREGLFDAGSVPDPLPRLCIPPTPGHPWFVMLLRDTNPLPVAATDRDVPANRLIEIQVFAPVDPHPDNRMVQTRSGELRFDVPLRAADEQRRRAIERDADALCAQLGRYRAGCSPQWAPLGTPHLMGSCRMGPADDGTSVTDRYGRVWGVENVYLATNGQIPTRLAVNPTLTATALAIRTADHIVDGTGHQSG